MYWDVGGVILGRGCTWEVGVYWEVGGLQGGRGVNTWEVGVLPLDLGCVVTHTWCTGR